MMLLSPGGGMVTRLTRVQRGELKSLGIFGNRPSSPCEDCGGYHLRACPRVKRKVFTSGNPTEVEYFETWDDTWVIFPEDIYDEDDDSE
jgi:hypothetical protein